MELPDSAGVTNRVLGDASDPCKMKVLIYTQQTSTVYVWTTNAGPFINVACSKQKGTCYPMKGLRTGKQQQHSGTMQPGA